MADRKAAFEAIVVRANKRTEFGHHCGLMPIERTINVKLGKQKFTAHGYLLTMPGGCPSRGRPAHTAHDPRKLIRQPARLILIEAYSSSAGLRRSH